MFWMRQNYVVTLLRDEAEANAVVEYALIMALVAVFIIASTPEMMKTATF